MGRVVGAGFRLGNSCTPVVDSCQCMAKPIQNCKVKNFFLKINIQKTKIMASSPITSWQINGEKMETVTDFLFLDSKITADSDCIHEIKRCLLLGRKTRTNLDRMLKTRSITLPTKIHIVKAMIFLVVMYRCESWTIQKVEC